MTNFNGTLPHYSRITMAIWVFLALTALLFAACSGDTNEVELPPDSTQPPTSIPVPTQSLESEPVVAGTAVTIPTIAPTPASLENGDFIVNLTSSTSDSDIANIQLAVHQVTISENTLTFTIAFENNATWPPRVRDIELRPEDFRLVDGTGVEYTAATVSDNLLTLVPMDGLPPGAANVGTVTFTDLPLPEATSYALQFAANVQYEPMTLDLMKLALASEPPFPILIANGEYPLDLTLFSIDEILAPLKLHLTSVTYTDAEIIFDVSFTNDGVFSGLEFLPSPTGLDAWLLDSERQAYAPLKVSDSLALSVTGEGGLDPGETHQGTITFPRLAGEGYFIFNNYVAAQLTTDGSGELYAELTSMSDDTAVPEFIPPAEDLAYADMEKLLEQYCATIINADNNAYLALHNQPAPDIETIFTGFTRLPISNCTAQLQPQGNEFAGADSGHINHLIVWLELLPKGIHPNNPFMTSLTMSFQKPDADWLITDVSYENDPPVWSLPDTILTETDHFYVLASAELQEAAPTYLAEVEQAYQTLSAAGLPMQGKYLGLFIANTEEYRRLTGFSNVGVAPSTLIPAPNDTIRNISRHFLINMEVLAGFPDRELDVITHELVHVVMREQGRPAMPAWLGEGLAEYYSGNYQRIRSEDFQQLSSIRLNELMPEGLNQQQYAFAGLFITFLAETYGEQTVLDFFYAYGQRPSTETELNQMETLTEQLAAQFFGLSLAELDMSFHEWLTTYNR